MIDMRVNKKSFDQNVILENIHIKLKKGERIVLMGPSGIGKTTLLRIFAGIDKDFMGHYVMPNNIALMFQEPNLLPWRNVYQNLQIFHPLASSTQINSMLQKVGLEGKSHMFPNQLSLGQQRRLALARCFLSKAELIILDEPFASLDDNTAKEMQKMILELLEEQQSTLILVSHNMDDAKAMSATPIMLHGKPATIA